MAEADNCPCLDAWSAPHCQPFEALDYGYASRMYSSGALTILSRRVHFQIQQTYIQKPGPGILSTYGTVSSNKASYI